MAKKKAKAATAAKPPTKTEVQSAIAEKTGLTKKEVASVFDALSEVIGKNLGRRGPKVFTIPGLVKFKVVNREAFDPATGALLGPVPASAHETGWKDTVIAYPGEVTRVKALFDVVGLYVWHCHILSHEDNEMMVPYCVGEPGVDCPDELFDPPVQPPA